MTTLYTPTVHPRVAQRHAAGPPMVADAMPSDGPLARFNTRFGLTVTVAVGSMWAAYLFTALALISLPSALRSGSLIIIIGWIAQTFLQLVLLPIIIVGQNVQGAATDKRAQSTFEDTEALLHINQQIQAHMQAQDEAIVTILDKLDLPRPPRSTSED